MIAAGTTIAPSAAQRVMLSIDLRPGNVNPDFDDIVLNDDSDPFCNTAEAQAYFTWDNENPGGCGGWNCALFGGLGSLWPNIGDTAQCNMGEQQPLPMEATKVVQIGNAAGEGMAAYAPLDCSAAEFEAECL